MSGEHLDDPCPAAGEYEIIRRTRDDAAGEALDKIAKFSAWVPGRTRHRPPGAGLGSPALPFSIPKISDGRLDFSFSGFKTAALRPRRWASGRFAGSPAPGGLDLVASYQRAMVSPDRQAKGAGRLMPRSLLLVGVACNSLLRESFRKTFESRERPVRVYIPSPAYTTDNAAMIAAAATPRFGRSPALDLALNASASLPLGG